MNKYIIIIKNCFTIISQKKLHMCHIEKNSYTPGESLTYYATIAGIPHLVCGIPHEHVVCFVGHLVCILDYAVCFSDIWYALDHVVIFQNHRKRQFRIFEFQKWLKSCHKKRKPNLCGAWCHTPHVRSPAAPHLTCCLMLHSWTPNS